MLQRRYGRKTSAWWMMAVIPWKASHGVSSGTHTGPGGAALLGSGAQSSRGLARRRLDGASGGTSGTADAWVQKTPWRSVVLAGPGGSAWTPAVRGAPGAWGPLHLVTGSCSPCPRSPALLGVCFLRVAMTVNSLGCSPPASQTSSALVYWRSARCQLEAVILAECLVCP